jgi:hypothetical protein
MQRLTTAAATANSNPPTPSIGRAAAARSTRVRSYRISSTAIILTGAATAFVSISTLDDVNEIFSFAAKVFGVALLVALASEAFGGVRNLIRTDLLMLLGLYALTFLEFLFPQSSFSNDVSVNGAITGTGAVLAGFAGLAVGRHLVAHRLPSERFATSAQLSPKQMIAAFTLAFILGYFYIFLAVNFDPFEAIRQMQWPRFSQSWTRGQLGGWHDLLNEVGALIYLLPPLGGAILAQRKRYSAASVLFVLAVLALTFFMGFTGGTRNVLLTYMITFCAAYLMLGPRLTWKRLILMGAPAIALSWLAAYYMIEARTFGVADYDFEVQRPSHFSIDYGLVNVSRLTEVFPFPHSFLGLEIPINGLIRPIPRAVWPGKPIGLSESIEDALGARGLTLAATYVGEFYMAGGILAVLLISLAFGALGAAWNRMGTNLQSNIRLILFASGFFAAGILMRSYLSSLPAILPTAGLYALARKKLRRVTGQPAVARPREAWAREKK